MTGNELRRSLESIGFSPNDIANRLPIDPVEVEQWSKVGERPVPERIAAAVEWFTEITS